jgi:hypothetical protein
VEEEDSVRVVVEGEVPVEVVEEGVIDGIVDFASVALVHYLLLIFADSRILSTFS